MLLAGSRPGQRLPRLGEAADLVGSACWMRLSGRGAGAVDSRWGETAAVYGLVASLLLVLAPGRYVAADMLSTWRLDGALLVPSTGVLVSMLLWGLAAAAACTRWGLVTVPTVFNGFLVSTVRFDPPVLLGPGEWAYLVLLPLLTLLAGVLLLERGERHAHLVGLGLAAERAALLRRTGAVS